MSFSLRGFTIVEVLIALAVSVAILAGGITVFQGRSEQTQFTQALYDLQSKLQNSISQASNKVVPGYQDYTCDDSGTALAGNDNPRPRLTTAVAGSETTNNKCIYLGQVLEFIHNDTTMYSYPVFALKNIPGGTADDFPSTPSQANPEIAATTVNAASITPVMVSKYVLGDNLKFKYVETLTDSTERDLMTLYSSLQDNNTSGNVITASAIGKDLTTQSINVVRDCVESNGCSVGSINLVNDTVKICVGDADKEAQLRMRHTNTGFIFEVRRGSCP